MLFFLLLFTSVFFLVKNNQFQRSKYLAVAQEIAGNVHAVTGSIESYLHLKQENEELTERVAELEARFIGNRSELYGQQDSILLEHLSVDAYDSSDYRFMPAHVVYNNTTRTDNYIQLNKGANDGIAIDMGVITPRGIVGVVVNTTPNRSLVIPVLNSKFRLSCKIKNSNYFGPLTWDGKDAAYTYLQELPRHAEINVGDTIITSGYSTIFPEGLPVGMIVDAKRQENDNYTSVKVRLFTDFTTLNNVIVVANKRSKEELELMQMME